MTATATDEVSIGLRPVACVIDTMHRDRAVADDAVDGRFTHVGVTLALGRRPDWVAGGLTDDEEWRIEWLKHYEGLDLAHAFDATGNPEFLRAWIDLVESYCEQVAIGHDTTDVEARRVQNWVYAWQRFTTSDRFAALPVADRSAFAACTARLVTRLGDDLDHIAHHLTAERNHRTLELYALLVGALALADRERATHTIELLADNADADITVDGVQRERSSDYHMIVLRSLVGTLANAAAAGLDVPDRLRRRVDAACTFALHLQRPDGTTPALADGDQADFRPLLELAADLLDRPDLRWAATLGCRGSAPVVRHATFPDGGYAFQRSGWGQDRRDYADERWAVIDCGPLGDGGHGHYDHLNVELAADGHRLVVDPGRYTYADPDQREGSWRHWFKGTAAHNTVTVDGLDQTPYRRGKPKGATSSATLRSRHTIAAGAGRPALDVIVAETRSPRYSVVHTRVLALIDDEYWVIVDRLVDPDPGAPIHAYVARWHLDPCAEGRTVVTERGLSSVHLPGATISVPQRKVSLEPGWVSPSYGTKHPAPIVCVHAAGAASATIVTVVMPGEIAPTLVDVELAGSDFTVVVGHRAATDVLRWFGGEPSGERRPVGGEPTSEEQPC